VESEGRELGRTQSLPVDSLQQPGCESGPQELVMKPSVVAPVEIWQRAKEAQRMVRTTFSA
jgi:hypothetical protein